MRQEFLPAVAQDRQSAEELAIARELEIGYRLYRMGELHDATRTLQSALSAVEGTGVAWSHETLVVDAWQTLARAFQERFSTSSYSQSAFALHVRLSL